MGFLQICLNGDYQFSHQTFVDVFIAHAVAKGITTQSSTINWDIPQGNNDIYFQKKISQKLQEIFKLESSYAFLVRFIEQKHYDIIDIIFKKLELTREVKRKIIKHKDSSNRNALHVATGCMESWNFLWNCVEKFTNESERRNMLLTSGDNDDSILKMVQDSEREVHGIISKIYEELFGRNYIIINLLDLKSVEGSSQEKKMTAFDVLFRSFKEHFEPEKCKQLLFVGSPCALFFDLIMSSFSIELSLKAVKVIFNPLELKNIIIQTGWPRNKALWHTPSSKMHKKMLLSFFEELFDASDEKKEIEDFLKHMKAQEESSDSESYSECLVIEKYLDALSKLFETKEFSENNSSRLFQCIGQILVLVSVSHGKMFPVLWNFVRKNFDKKEQKNLLLFYYGSINTVIAVAQNEDESITRNFLEALADLFDQVDFRRTLEDPSEYFLIEIFYYFTSYAKLHCLTMLWSFFQENLGIRKQKLMLLQKNQNVVSAFMKSAQSKDKLATKFFISTARNLLSVADFAIALKSEYHNWVVDTLCYYAALAESGPFSMFWLFLQEYLDRLGQTLPFFQKNRQGLNAFTSLAQNKDKLTIKFFIKQARRLITFLDFDKDVRFINESWIVDTLCHFAGVADFEAFELFWSFVQENLYENKQKVILLQKKPNGLNALMSSACNQDLSTIEFIMNIARELLVLEDFTEALRSEDQNWVVETLKEF